MHPENANEMGLQTGDWVTVSSRRGEITLRLLVTERSLPKTIFVPFHFAEAAANLLTLDRVDAVRRYQITRIRPFAFKGHATGKG